MKNKKGISLIVLIVTIIVIIILAAAVILTLNKNNPIDSSRVAQLSENRDALNSAIQLYYGKKMAETQGIFETSQIFVGGTATNSAGETVTLTSIVGTQNGETSYYQKNNATESAIDTKFPTITSATWYINVESGLVYLVYADYDAMPSWMFTDTTKSAANMDKNLKEFVKVSADLT